LHPTLDRSPVARAMPTSSHTDRPVLIVEDDDELRDVLIVACEMNGHAAIGCASADEALAQLRGGLRPCLIVFDLVMPNKSGWEFRAEQLADSELAAIPSVATSAAVQGDTMRETLQVEALLPKPIDMDRLLALIERHCAKTERRRT
jgi:two-component system, chemotaxis family, chemotaxis protein CheY